MSVVTSEVQNERGILITTTCLNVFPSSFTRYTVGFASVDYAVELDDIRVGFAIEGCSSAVTFSSGRVDSALYLNGPGLFPTCG